MKNKYYCGKCEHIGMYTGSYTHSEKLCKRYAAILKVDGNDVEKCVPCICETLEAENVALRNEADENAALSMENKMRADRLEKENATLRERLGKSMELPCKVGDILYTVTFSLCDGYDDCGNRLYNSGWNILKEKVTEKNFYRMCDFVRNGKAFFSEEGAKVRLKELQGGGK